MADEKTDNKDILRGTRWSSLVEELRQWPPDAPEWDIVQKFIDQVQVVAKQKCQEREETGRLRLQQILDRLRENYEGDFTFFGFDSLALANWQASRCPTDRIPERTKTAENLLAQLDRRRTLNQQPPKNYQEASRYRTDLGAVEAEISALAKQFHQDFSKTAPEPPRTLDEDTEDDDQPSPQPPSPGQGPSGDPSDSGQEQKAEKDVSPSAEVSQKESSLHEEKSKAEPLPHSEDPKTKHIQTATSVPQPPDEKVSNLRSVRDAALLLEKDDSDELWISLGWGLLAEGDWAGAYWLAVSLKAAGRDVPVAPELLAVLQGSSWLENDTDSLVRDILEVASGWTPQNTAERLLGLAAAMRPNLIAPYTGLVGWLPQKDEINSALGTLADAIRTFAGAGYPLRSEDLQGVENQANLTESIQDTVEKARRLLESNQSRRLKMLRATSVLRRLVDQGGDLSLLLIPVSENRADQVDQVRQRISNLKGRRIEDRIRHIDRELTPVRPSTPDHRGSP